MKANPVVQDKCFYADAGTKLLPFAETAFAILGGMSVITKAK